MMLTVMLFLLILETTESGPFHCLRVGQNCPPSAKCNDNGTCTCPPQLQGDDCSVVKADIISSGCRSLKCKNGGVCVKKSNGEVCACSVDYYGADCSEKRYQIICNSREIIFNVNPVGTFSGFASVIDKQGISNCQSVPVPDPPLKDDGIPDTWKGHVLRLNYNSFECGTIYPEETNNTYVYKQTVSVQFRKQIQTANDDLFEGSCYLQKFVTVESVFFVKKEKPTTTPIPNRGGKTHELSAVFFLIIFLTTWLNQKPL